jgi:UDP-2,3-diacylglucosamine hydrolase
VTTLFISDLHLAADRPEIGEQLIEFLKKEATQADALFILGDLFEVWIGDDDPDPYNAGIEHALGSVVKSGTPVFFMHGNRDFMIGKKFSMETGVQLIPDPFVIGLYGKDILLSHGDAYCTDDVEYQAIRKMTRDPEWQAMMLEKPLEERRAFAVQAREASKAHGEGIDEVISDVNVEAIEQAMLENKVRLMVHGHTHRPSVHAQTINGMTAKRIVLGDWYEQGSILRWNQRGPQLRSISRD